MTTGLYVGGLPPDFTLARTDTGDRAVIRKSFIGCMRGLRVEKQRRPTPVWEELEWDKATESRNTVPGWQGCPLELAEGVHFLGRGWSLFWKLAGSLMDGRLGRWLTGWLVGWLAGWLVS